MGVGRKSWATFVRCRFLDLWLLARVAVYHQPCCLSRRIQKKENHKIDLRHDELAT